MAFGLALDISRPGPSHQAKAFMGSFWDMHMSKNEQNC
jgi:hypothetical protein